jgi:hypothetical protein
MKRATVTIFLVHGATQAPEPAFKLEVEAPSDDGLRDAATEALRQRGLSVRALSFGPAGLLAYAEVAR